MSTKPYPVDPECVRLAQHFLAGERVHVAAALHETEAQELSTEIQKAIESWFDHRDGDEAESKAEGES